MKNEDLLISVIITYYQTLDYTKKIMEKIDPQLNEKIEVIIVDDGCNEKELDKYNAKVIHLEENSGGASKPRNVGLDNANGEYIVFIDGDDMITEDYIETLSKDAQEKYDYYVYKWYSNDTNIYGIQHKENMYYNWNVWSYMFKREVIGNNRFDENMIAGEDIDWLRRTITESNTRKEVDKAIYRYNSQNENSISHLLAQGVIKARK